MVSVTNSKQGKALISGIPLLTVRRSTIFRAQCVTTTPTSKPVTVPSSSCLYRLRYNRYKFWEVAYTLPNTSMCNSDIVFGSEYATQYCSELITENICLLKNNNKIIYFLKSTLASSDIFILRKKTHKKT